MPKDHIYELKFLLDTDALGLAEILRCALVGQGFAEEDIVEDDSDSEIKVAVFFSSTKKAQKTREAVRALKLGRVRAHVTKLQNDIWKNKWKKGLKPFKITRELTVKPLRYKAKNVPPPKKDVIYVDTSLAFGSGTHATTRAMAGFLRLKSGHYKDLFDVGTGTGILSIIGSRYGAERIWAVDIEQEAVATAKRNFFLNGTKVDRVGRVDLKHFKQKDEFDMVAANMLTDILISLKRQLVAYVKKGKYLAVSGISVENYDRFRGKFDSSSLKCLKITRDKDWVGILYKKL